MAVKRENFIFAGEKWFYAVIFVGRLRQMIQTTINSTLHNEDMDSTEKAFITLVKAYERIIYKVCYLYATPAVSLEDLYQEVVVNLWKGYPNFRGESKPSTWIYRIALNTCITFLRKEKNAPLFVELSPEADRMDEEDETHQMLRRLYDLIARLNHMEKSLILLYLEDKSYEEIAEITGLTQTNVATRLSRIKEKLRKMNREG